MNKSYKSIWNESLGTYVAASEIATSGGRKVSSARKARRAPERAMSSQIALEQRIVFDAALPVLVIDASVDKSTTTDVMPEDSVSTQVTQSTVPTTADSQSSDSSDATVVAPVVTADQKTQSDTSEEVASTLSDPTESADTSSGDEAVASESDALPTSTVVVAAPDKAGGK